MKAIKRLLLISPIGALLCFSASAQEDTAPIRFSAVCRTVNDAGNIVRKNISNESLIRECARDNNITNRSNLRLVYHFGGDQNGDTIEVFNRRTDEVACTKFKLLFAMETISNDDGTEIVELAKVFNDQQSEEVGTAVIRKTTNANGRTRVTGNLNYFISESGTNGPSICTGTFSSGSSPSSPGIQLPDIQVPDFPGLGNQNNQ